LIFRFVLIMNKNSHRKFVSKTVPAKVPVYAGDEWESDPSELQDKDYKRPYNVVIRTGKVHTNTLVDKINLNVSNGSVSVNVRKVNPAVAVKVVSGLSNSLQVRQKKVQQANLINRYNRRAVGIMNGFLEFDDGKFLKSRVAQRLTFLGNILEHNFTNVSKYSGTDLQDFENFKLLSPSHREKTIYALRLFFDTL